MPVSRGRPAGGGRAPPGLRARRRWGRPARPGGSDCRVLDGEVVQHRGHRPGELGHATLPFREVLESRGVGRCAWAGRPRLRSQGGRHSPHGPAGRDGRCSLGRRAVRALQSVRALDVDDAERHARDRGDSEARFGRVRGGLQSRLSVVRGVGQASALRLRLGLELRQAVAGARGGVPRPTGRREALVAAPHHAGQRQGRVPRGSRPGRTGLRDSRGADAARVQGARRLRQGRGLGGGEAEVGGDRVRPAHDVG
mmetsp:Transcript_3388/g.10184  ORF Transcript_3388/g.10184 Transcript_3388/m.10184 type:complete len:254 (+) Transcript_3388:1283-2044(+)